MRARPRVDTRDRISNATVLAAFPIVPRTYRYTYVCGLLTATTAIGMMHNVSRHNGPSVHLYPRGAKRSITVDRDGNARVGKRWEAEPESSGRSDD